MRNVLTIAESKGFSFLLFVNCCGT